MRLENRLPQCWRLVVAVLQLSKSEFTTTSSTSLALANQAMQLLPTNSTNSFANPSAAQSIPAHAFPTNQTDASPTTSSTTTTPSLLKSLILRPPLRPDSNGFLQVKGLLFSNNNDFVLSMIGFGQSTPAIKLALYDIAAANLLPTINLTFEWYVNPCIETASAGQITQLIMVDTVDVVIGPACLRTMSTACAIASSNNIPLILWGPPFEVKLADSNRFPTVMSTSITTVSIGVSLLSLMKQFDWKEFAIVYTASDLVLRVCDYVQLGIQNVFDSQDVDVNIVFKSVVLNTTDSFTYALRNIKTKARVIVTCFDDNTDIRRFLLAAYDLKMYDDNYVYVPLMVNTHGGMIKTSGILTDFWKLPDDEDGRNNDALVMVQQSLGIGMRHQDKIERFDTALEQNFNQFPFYCDDDCMGYKKEAAAYACYLYDAVYLYALILNKTLENGNFNDLRNGVLMANNKSYSFDGILGHVEITSNGTRLPVFSVAALDENNTLKSYATITVINISNFIFTAFYDNEQSGIWISRKGVRPTGQPRCGYYGYECAPSISLIVSIATAAFFVLFAVGGVLIAYFLRERIKYQTSSKLEWEIPYVNLTKIENDRKNELKSIRSVQSMNSNSSKAEENLIETENHCFFFYRKTVVYASKHPVRVQLAKTDINALRQLRNFDHDNVNRFLGLCVDGPMIYSVWKYCQRGSLQDVLLKEGYARDQIVMFALIRDISNGLSAIHNSCLEVHGALSSDCCLINDHWQVKISNFGLGVIKEHQPLSKKERLWTAPELLRDNNLRGTKSGDVYSFAIVCSELLNRECAWSGVNSDDEIDDIIYRLKRGGSNPPRPAIQPPDDVNESIIDLVHSCWDERLENRPEMDRVCSMLKHLLNNGMQNLMDYVFLMLEQYASSLEQEVELRTKELIEEKRKSDILLYRMLPQQVADKLKTGSVVEPESFDLVTVFFSDVVSFTTLAGMCTPLQVVNLLNDMYTVFDSIIEQCDAYKLETIGDGYLVCSGLPRRNGDRHVVEIAKMSIEFLKSLQSFRIAHLPNYRINIRIGFHTGPCVAGIVGLSMPKYCLFGDTINIASRMESNSKPGRIHLSLSANHYLMETNESFLTESRGKVMIKGKGMMETYWLLGKDQFFIQPVERASSTTLAQPSADTANKLTSSHGLVDSTASSAAKQQASSDRVSSNDYLYASYLNRNYSKVS